MNQLDKLLLPVILVASVAVIALQIPAIQTVRNDAYDAALTSDLTELKQAISTYATKNDELPATLAAASASSELDKDISTYKYVKKTSTNYQLCATFKTSTISTTSKSSTASEDSLYSYEDFKTHDKGEHCFDLKETIYPSYSSDNYNDTIDSYCTDDPEALFCN